MIAMLLTFSVLTSMASDGQIHLRSCRPMAGKVSTLPSRLKAKRYGTGDLFIGDRRQLTILVNFKDQVFSEEEPLPLWDNIFNKEGFSESPFWGSIHDYFYDQSYGQFRLTFDLIHISINESRVKYRSTDWDDENSQFLVKDIVDTLLTKDIDWSQYDWDGDSYVDQLLILYAGKGQNAGGDRNTIWPHQWWMSQHKDPNTQEYLSALPVYYDGKDYFVDCYCTVAELDINGGYGTFGTICHEYTHCFGFPDFYNSNESFLGKWDLMDYGNYNNDGYCPTSYSAHERMLMGWLTPTELTEDVSITQMPALADEPRAYLIRNEGNEDEFYMVENRQPTSWDKYLPGSGIVVFHIDYDEAIWSMSTGAPNTFIKQRYYIIPANGKTSTYSSQYWPYPYQENDSLTNNSNPAAILHNANVDGEYLMSKSLYQMRVDEGLASFDFKIPEVDAIDEPQISGSRPVETLYHMGRIAIVRCENGEVKKVVR